MQQLADVRKDAMHSRKHRYIATLSRSRMVEGCNEVQNPVPGDAIITPTETATADDGPPLLPYFNANLFSECLELGNPMQQLAVDDLNFNFSGYDAGHTATHITLDPPFTTFAPLPMDVTARGIQDLQTDVSPIGYQPPTF